MHKTSLVSVHNVQYLRCCKNFKSSYTLVYCGLKFSRALILNIMIQTPVPKAFGR